MPATPAPTWLLPPLPRLPLLAGRLLLGHGDAEPVALEGADLPQRSLRVLGQREGDVPEAAAGLAACGAGRRVRPWTPPKSAPPREPPPPHLSPPPWTRAQPTAPPRPVPTWGRDHEAALHRAELAEEPLQAGPAGRGGQPPHQQRPPAHGPDPAQRMCGPMGAAILPRPCAKRVRPETPPSPASVSQTGPTGNAAIFGVLCLNRLGRKRRHLAAPDTQMGPAGNAAIFPASVAEMRPAGNAAWARRFRETPLLPPGS